jgi:hypothetical protein
VSSQSCPSPLAKDREPEKHEQQRSPDQSGIALIRLRVCIHCG